jgi:hypothetical protein
MKVTIFVCAPVIRIVMKFGPLSRVLDIPAIEAASNTTHLRNTGIDIKRFPLRWFPSVHAAPCELAQALNDAIKL